MRLSMIYGYALLVAMTVMYCLLAWYGAGIWSVFYPSTADQTIPVISLICIAPLPLSIWLGMIHWQLLAIISLIVSITLSVKRSKEWSEQNDLSLPLVLHLGWIVFAICCHLVGAMAPILTIGAVIAS